MGPGVLDAAGPVDWAIAVSYVVVIAAVAAEAGVLASNGNMRPWRRLATTAPMAAGAIAVGVAYTAVFAWLWRGVGSYAPDGLADWWAAHRALEVAVAFVVWDASGWLYHAVGHRTRVGWAAHQAHHSTTAVDMSVAFQLSWTPFHGLAHHPMLALAGFDLRTIIVCSAISNALQALQHTSATIRFPKAVAAAVMTPQTHRIHHRVDGASCNLGPVFTIWDRLAGTWQPTLDGPAVYGPDRGANPVRVELAGWVDLTRSVLRRPVPEAPAV